MQNAEHFFGQASTGIVRLMPAVLPAALGAYRLLPVAGSYLLPFLSGARNPNRCRT